jgi:capsular exopolysaccharide family
MKNIQSSEQEIDQLLSAKNNSSSSFDIIGFILKSFKYWYLFVIAFAIGGGLALLKNKSWTPTYRTSTTLMIQDNRSGQRNDFMSGYGNSLQKNINNQMIMYTSYDFLSRAIEKLNLTNEIYIKHRFRNTILYKHAPIEIETNFIANQAYGLEFKINGVDSNSYIVSFEGNDKIQAFSLEGNYDESIQHDLFFMEVHKTDLFVDSTPTYDLYFHFFSKNQLINSYASRISSYLLMDNSTVMEISLTGKVAQRDVDMLNYLNAQFFEDDLMRKNEIAERSIDFIERQLIIMKDSVDISGQKLNNYQRSSGLYSADMSSAHMKEMESLNQIRNELRLRRNYLDYLSNAIATTGNDFPDPSSMGVANSQLSAYITQYNLLITEMKSLGTESPIYKRNQVVLNDLKKTIQDFVTSLYSTLQIEENDANQRYGRASSEVASLPERERALLGHERDYKMTDTYYTYLAQRRIESQIQKASNTPDNYVIDEPRVNGVINGSALSRNYVMYILIALLFPLVFVICKEYLFKLSVQARDEVERITQLPFLGTVERTQFNKEKFVLKNHPRSRFAESFRNIRTRMEYLAKKTKPISMLITSTEPGDGKTFIITNLASVYEIGKKKVILVDFDLRRPALTESIGLKDKKGLTNYLIGQTSIDDIIVKHEESGLDIIPAGAVPPNPSELIQTDKTQELLEELIKRYDYVLLDCSPVGLVSDAHYLARLVDVVIYTVRNEKTNKNFLKYTIKELKEDGISNLAIVYNDVDSKKGSYGYYGNSKYYGKSSYYLKHSNYYHND